MSHATQTAVVVPVAAVEEVVDRHRRDLDPSAAMGVPAHITVLVPFLPPSKVEDTVIRRLEAVFQLVSPFDCTFTKCDWFGNEVLWLAPEPEEVFRDFTGAVAAEFVGYAPYGGQFGDVVPHLTIGVGQQGTVERLQSAERDVQGRLPITAHIDHALLIAGTEEANSWHTLARLPFGVSGC